MTSPLEAATAGIRQATTDVPAGVDGIYRALGELEELIRMLGGYTGRLGTAAAGLPGITGGLRIDDVGEPIPPEAAVSVSSRGQTTSGTTPVPSQLAPLTGVGRRSLGDQGDDRWRHAIGVT